ncbi:MAG: dihydrolipoyl dehydrogenase [Phycisphaerae bacterium]|nr:dihydrolipoyl dehydrogenase [Phycisphaerae bacterium]MDW8262867.1 dihydrolipoyl dehydrogenase [Phycisphaerales bacterium]
MSQYDLVVIGAGPGGYVAAIRAAQLGMKVACVERESLGGTCLNVGCIPSKALLDSSERYYAARHQLSRHGIRLEGVSLDLAALMKRKDEVVKQLAGGVGFLFRKNKVEHLPGHGKILGPGRVEVTARGVPPRVVQARNILIATGSAPSEIPALRFDGAHILSSTEGISLREVPTKLIVVGAGYIGLELGSVWSRLGSEVLVLEFLDGVLPSSDRECANALQKSLEKQGLKFRFQVTAQKAEVAGGKVKVHWTSRDGRETGVEAADKVLVAVGRRPVTDNLGLESVGIRLDARGFIPVDERFRAAEGVYAIGDVIGGIMLAHKAEEEGVACVELLAGRSGHVNYACCPSVVYTHPELASVGFTEEQCKSQGLAYKVGRFPMTANGRAKGMDETEGFVKILADARTDRVLGVHILSAHASDMIHECVAVMEFHGSSEDIARGFHAHPTLPEAIKEAALAVDGRAIHA